MDVYVIVDLVLKIVALAMGIVSIVLTFFPRETDSKNHINLLIIGLPALAIDALQ